MSTTSTPISPTRFASALPSLPLSTLHAKAAELQNSIMHLRSSNAQMLPFAEEGDVECREAVFENLEVIGRMSERIEILRREVEGRGQLWPGAGAGGEGEGSGKVEGVNGEDVVNGHHVDGANGSGVANGLNGESRGEEVRAPSGRLTDDELRRQLEARMAEGDDDDGDDGVHL